MPDETGNFSMAHCLEVMMVKRKEVEEGGETEKVRN